MATIVPVSHSHRWRSRSRNASMDNWQQEMRQSTIDYTDVDMSDDDENDAFDNVQCSPWLVVPQGYMSSAQPRSIDSPNSPNTSASWKKAMEMRRASGF